MLKINSNDYFYYFYFTINLLISLFVGCLFLEIFVYFYYNTHINNTKLLNHFLFILTNKKFYLAYGFYFLVITLFIILIVFILLQKMNKYQLTKKFSRWATWGDIVRMKPSIVAKDGFCLGRFNGKVLKYNTPLSTLCVAPAGAGKTSGLVIPTIFSSKRHSLIINDPKGELHKITRKYREKLGKVIKIEWKGEDSDSWNPYDLSNLPADTSDRAEIIETIVNILITQTEGDKFWVLSARKLFTAVSLYLIYTKELQSISSSIAEVKDFLSKIGNKIKGDENENEEEAETEDENIIKNNFKYYANDVKNYEIPEVIKSRIELVFLEMSVASLNTIGSILATIGAELSIFNNEKVRKITSNNSFNIKDIRNNIKDEIITIYLISPAFDQDIYGILSAIFVEYATRYLTSQNIDDIKRNVGFILDEVAFLPKTKAVEQGPAIARGYKVNYLFVCQDLGQLEQKYGKNGLENIITNTAFKIILTQNNDITAKRLASMGGKIEIQEFVGTGKNRHKIKKIEDFISSSDVMNLPPGKQIVLVQNYAKTLVFCDIPYYFNDKEILKKIKINFN